MSHTQDSASAPDRAHATVRSDEEERYVQFIDQGDGNTEVIVLDGATIETRIIVDQMDLLHAIELVAS